MIPLCKACGKPLDKIYYQRRAADEPPDEVVYCHNCPLNTDRLLFKEEENEVRKHIKTFPRIASNSDNNKQNKFASTLFKLKTSTHIIVRGIAAANCLKDKLATTSVLTTIESLSVTLSTDAKPVITNYHITGSATNQAHINGKSKKIAPFITYRFTDIYTSDAKVFDYADYSNRVVSEYEYILQTPNLCDSAVLRTSRGNSPPYMIIETASNDNNDILKILESILVVYGTESTMTSLVKPTLWNTLYIQSGNAYDWPSAPSTGYTYAWKPDGERYWYIKYGSIWLFSRRLLSATIAGWNMSSSLSTVECIGPVLDVEVMIGFPPILIDLLITKDGIVTPISRTLDYVLDQFKYIVEEGIVDVPVHVRDYYRSEKELLATKHTLEYPVDGVVGIQDGSTNIIKLKDEKSMELELQDNGDLLTSDKILIATSNLQATEEVGSIVELRFTKDSMSDVGTIKELFVRTDKRKANSLEACKNIFSSVSDTPDDLARRNAVQWCNSIRAKLHQVASRSRGKGRVILDVGAGDGQAVSNYSEDPEVSYLLLEPDERKCRSLFRRLKGDTKNDAKLLDTAANSVNALGLLITKKLKYVIVCATLKQFLSQKECISTLKTCMRYCIASFSISYTASELQDLAIEGLNVVGCGYMYDSVNSAGILIKEHGVVMKYCNYKRDNSSSYATVEWGKDKVYSEPAITISDFEEIFYCKLAKHTVPIMTDSKISLLNTVAAKVYIISTNKHGI